MGVYLSGPMLPEWCLVNGLLTGFFARLAARLGQAGACALSAWMCHQMPRKGIKRWQ